MLQTLVLSLCLMESSWGWGIKLLFFFCLAVFCYWISLPFVLPDAVEQCIVLELCESISVPQERLEFVIRSWDNLLPHYLLSVNLGSFMAAWLITGLARNGERSRVCRMKYRTGERKAGRGSELGAWVMAARDLRGGRDHPAEHFSLFWSQSKKSQFYDG